MGSGEPFVPLVKMCKPFVDNKTLSIKRDIRSKCILLISASLAAIFIYGLIDTTEPGNLIPSKDNVLKKTLLRIYVKRRRRNMTTDKYEITREMTALSQIVQDNLDRLQKSFHCKSPHLVCGHRSNCGFGCHVHHRMFCLMLSYVTNRPLIFNVNSHLSYTTNWSGIFKEMSSPCRGSPDAWFVNWNTAPVTLKDKKTGALLTLPVSKGFPISKNTMARLRKIHLKPFIWMAGQFAKFAMRLHGKAQDEIEKSIRDLNFERPVVGIHIRRTDKLKEQEGSFHPISKYMEEADNYFKEFHPEIQRKSVYVASEDSAVYDEVVESYHGDEWNVVGFRPEETTENLNERKDYLLEIIRDVLMLSRCDFVVCGFSSNICRLVYELMQTENQDATARVISLDKFYYFNVLGYQLTQKMAVIDDGLNSNTTGHR